MLIVVTRCDVLDAGNAGVGYLNAAVGVGGVIGAAAAIALVGRKRLASDFGLGLVFWGLPIVLIGVLPADGLRRCSCSASSGSANTIVDVAGPDVLQRAVADDVLAGSSACSRACSGHDRDRRDPRAAAVGAVGPRGALIVFGLLLPVLAVLACAEAAQRSTPAR